MEAWFRQLAVPRRPGSVGVRHIERLVTDRLIALGYTVRDQPFETSPRRLAAGSVLVMGVGMWVLLMGALLTATLAPPVLWAVGLIGLVGVGTISHAVSRGSLGRWPSIPAVNLVARPGDADGAPPRVWLVAHLDSKAQRVSLAGRIVGLTLLMVSAATVLALTVGYGGVPWSATVVWPVAVVGGFAGAALGGPPLLGESPGAVDNASGIVAVVEAARLLAHRPDVGIVVTGAEELGMEGARAFAASQPGGELAINVDGVDRAGRFNVMEHAVPGSAVAGRLAGALSEVLADAGPVRKARLPWGVFVDGSVLAVDGGLPGVTVSRGSWATLAVIHTPRDTPERTDATGAVVVGRAIARVVDRWLG